MVDETIGIIVRSRQLNGNSLAMASLGNGSFLDFLLDNLNAGFPDLPKIFAMEFADLQEIDDNLMKSIRSRGFEVYIGDIDVAHRIISAARQHGLDSFVDVPVINPLTCTDAVAGMIAAHRSSGADVTVCRNLPANIAGTVFRVDAYERFQSLSDEEFQTFYQLGERLTQRRNAVDFMLANPDYFSSRLYTYPIKWQGKIRTFERGFTDLQLGQKDHLDNVRNIIYTINKPDLTPDDIIDAKLIRNMQNAWTQPNRLDTKYIVADQAGWSTNELYEKAAVEEVDWFVLKDDLYLNNQPIEKRNILEVGCGHGRLVRVLAKRFEQVFGTDATPDRYREARYRCRKFDNIVVTNNDGRSLSQYKDDFFDFTFAHGVFVHINSKNIINNYIAEMARVLKPKGRLKFDCYFGAESFGVTPTQFGIGGRYTEEEINTIFNANGIELVNIEHVETRQFSRSGTEYSMPIKQILVIGSKE